MPNWTQRFSLEGRRALVTGATKGIGYETCRVLADAGADIAAVGRDEAGLADIKREVEAMGRRCVTIAADLATVEGPKQAAARALEAFGTIDILVNNAGVTTLKSIIDTPVDDWDWVNNVNLRAPYLLAQALVPNMIRQRMGKVINISSQSGVVALDDHGAYGASKGGLNMLTRVMTVEWAKHNIQSNSVCPTVILTPMGEMVWGDPAKGDPMKAKIPAGRFGRTTEVADLILFLASSASDMICGQTILIDGGFTAQ
ncbi:SDR family NAD(P)-dependent oxidoreductase [Aestuariivirga sp.]|jgi:2-deoxy-D-gluconate 3-dehydrogenase|uniref:SDR family NAD(P)-dependent oxidoreductase n=1 Tax=Aestuariivirga sp. TaxID=2650926 RepID=UPI003783D684